MVIVGANGSGKSRMGAWIEQTAGARITGSAPRGRLSRYPRTSSREPMSRQSVLCFTVHTSRAGKIRNGARQKVRVPLGG